MRRRKFSFGDQVSRIKGFLGKIPEKDPIILEKVSSINIHRIYYVTFFALPIYLAHIILFVQKIGEATGEVFVWRLGIILAHSIMLVITSILGVMAYIIKRQGKFAGKLANGLQGFVVFTFLMAGVAISTVDQLITTSMTPFIVMCTAVAVVMLIRPYFAVISYFAAYAVFYYVISLTQNNPEILLSIRVNGITAAGTGLCVAILLWRNTITNLRYQEELAATAVQLAEHNKLKDKLFTIVSHDIRDPLAVLVNLTELLEDEKANLGSDTGEIIDLVKVQVKNTYFMVENLLEWFRNQMVGSRFNPQECELSEIVQEAIEIQGIKCETKNIRITSEIKEGIILYADREALELILRNLLSNAVKFSYNEGCVIIHAQEQDDMVIIAVSDTGIGIEPEKVQTLFNESHIGFSRGSVGTTGEKGAGLGLMICKEFVCLNGGEIWVESIPGQGSTFYFSIPCARK